MKNAARAGLLAVAMTGVAASWPPTGLAASPLEGTAGTGRLTGRVVLDGPQQPPVRRALVSIRGTAIDGERTTATDAAGRFSFRDLPPGRYLLNASKPGHVPVDFGSRRPGRGPGTSIAIAPDQTIPVELVMLPGAVVAGHITDHKGRPQRAAIVTVLHVSGWETPVPVASARTDDLGEYRAYGLAPGRYVVAAQPGFGFNGAAESTDADFRAALAEVDRRRGGLLSASPPPTAATVPRRPVSYAPSLYPGVDDVANASVVELGAGEERLDVDVSFSLVPTTHLSIRFVDPSGHVPERLQATMPWPGYELGLIERSYIGTVPMRATLEVVNGRIDRRALVPGRYRLLARASSSRAGTGDSTATPLDLWAATDIVINGEIERELTVVLQPGMTVAGTLRGDPGVDLSSSRLILTRVSNEPGVGVAQIPIGRDGSFVVKGVAPAEYVLGLSGTHDLTIGAARSTSGSIVDARVVVEPGLDIMDLNILIARSRTSLEGHLVDSLRRPAPDHAIVVFPVDRSLWMPGSPRIRQTRPALDGSYAVADLPPGEYLVSAVTELEPADLADVSFLELLAGSATTVAISDSEPAVLNMQIAQGGKSSDTGEAIAVPASAQAPDAPRATHRRPARSGAPATDRHQRDRTASS
jgi:hypothetical protein